MILSINSDEGTLLQTSEGKSYLLVKKKKKKQTHQTSSFRDKMKIQTTISLLDKAYNFLPEVRGFKTADKPT